MPEVSERDMFVESNKLDLLLGGLSTSMPATVLNSTMLLVVLWGVASKDKLLLWFFCNVAFVLIRYCMFFYDKKNKDNYSLTIRRNVILATFVIAGLFFGSSGLLFGEIAKFEYVVFVYFVTGGMVVGSLSAYHNNLDIHFAYSGTIFFITTLAVYLQHNNISNAMAVLGCVFYATTSVTAIRLNKDLSESLLLRFDNEMLVKNLNEQKIQTDKLNEELIVKNVELKELSLVDPLTGLKNRRCLFEIVTPEIDSINKKQMFERRNNSLTESQKHKSFGILMIDIDHFKRVNDEYGHDSGDLVLKQFAGKLKEKVRIDDIVGRIGGEEFIIILKEPTEDYLKELAIRIIKFIEESIFEITNQREIRLTCSLGFIYYPFFPSCPGYLSFEMLMSLADKALYQAKECGRNKAVRAISTVCSGEESKDIEIVEEIIADIFKAIDKRQITFETV